MQKIEAASISFVRLQEVSLEAVETREGLSALVAKCISTSSRKVKLNVKYDRTCALDPSFFSHRYPALDNFTVEANIDRHTKHLPGVVDSLDQLFTDIDLVKCGELPTLGSLSISGMYLCPATLRNIAESLKCNHLLTNLEVKNCTIDDGTGIIGSSGDCARDNLESQPVGNPALPALKESEQALATFVSSITMCAQLSVLDIPVNEHSVHVLWQNGLAGLKSLHMCVAETSPEKNIRLQKSPSNDLQNIKFPNLTDLSITGGGITENFRHSQEQWSHLTGDVWKEFLTCLTGHRKLRQGSFYCLDLTNCLSIFLAKEFPSLRYLYFNQCKLSEDGNPEHFMGNLPAIDTFQLISDKSGKLWKYKLYNVVENSAFRLLFACLVGSKKLRSLEVGFWFNRESQDQFHPTMEFNDLTNCLAILFSKPLVMLNRMAFSLCKLSEDILDLSGFEGNLPAISNFDTSEILGHCMVDNSVLRLICACLTGSLCALNFCYQPLIESYMNLSNCLALLFKEPLASLHNINFEGCVLEEDLESISQMTSPLPILPFIRMISLSVEKTQRHDKPRFSSYHDLSDVSAIKTMISSSAMCFICKAIAGSPHLEHISFDGYDMSGCLSHLLSKPSDNLTSQLILKNCIVNEDTHSVSARPKVIPGILKKIYDIDLSTCRVSNSAARVLCTAISCSKRVAGLQSFKVFDTDLTGCIPLLFNSSSNFQKYSKFEVVGCSFNDTETSESVKRGCLGVETLDLGWCESVSGHAAMMLFDAVAESHTLTSIIMADVDLQRVQPGIYNFPMLQTLSMEGCLFSKGQILAFVKAKKDKRLPCLQSLYLNRAKGIAGTFILDEMRTENDTQTINSCPASESMIHICIGLVVLGVRDSDITKSDVKNLSKAISNRSVEDLRKIEINLDHCEPDIIGIFQSHNVNLLDVAAQPRQRLHPEHIPPRPSVQQFKRTKAIVK